ncbi:nucleotide disphospho-sugar-binding domain-containing protein [Actinokineospora globicatena]|uniref:Glycosyl transferase n=1 Tax=Actinokineospora globicatena TaxID=103729 RepID=A0A9W6QGY8_9PSEU|nr:nucleotide disphospho-sugar-binding domain-containing protein [Actinokineospora globicatena]GLW89891.1 glycosyl transferase [Actinokineospora globicatena]
MRVLVIPLPYPTHLMAMVPLCWALRAHGHEVLVACPPEVLATAHAAGLTTVAVPSHGGPPDGAPLRFPLPAFGDRLGDAGRWLWRETATTVVRGSLNHLPHYLRLAEGWRPSLLLVDVCAVVGRVVGGLLDVPVALHRWGVDPTAGPFAERAHELLDPVCRARGIPGLPDPALVIDPCPPSLQAVDAPPGEPVRYVPYNGGGAVPDWVAPPASTRRICVCMGRMVLDATGPDPLRRAVAAACALPDVEVVVAVSGAHRRWLDDLPANAVVAESVPLHLFLDTCALVVCAGGSGTAFTATRLGVPQLVLPQYFDQFDYARNLAAAGAGLCLPDERAQSDHRLLTDSIAALLDDTGFASAAVKLADEMASMPPPTDLARTLASRAA